MDVFVIELPTKIDLSLNKLNWISHQIFLYYSSQYGPVSSKLLFELLISTPFINLHITQRV